MQHKSAMPLLLRNTSVFLQDVSLLNEARCKLEQMIDWFCGEYNLEKPRTYREVAHKEYLSFAKSKRPNFQKIREAVKAQLGMSAEILDT